MLVLTRRPSQRIVVNCLGERIEVVLVSIKHDQARIGIVADKDRVHILREELEEKEVAA